MQKKNLVMGNRVINLQKDGEFIDPHEKLEISCKINLPGSADVQAISGKHFSSQKPLIELAYLHELTDATTKEVVFLFISLSGGELKILNYPTGLKAWGIIDNHMVYEVNPPSRNLQMLFRATREFLTNPLYRDGVGKLNIGDDNVYLAMKAIYNDPEWGFMCLEKNDQLAFMQKLMPTGDLVVKTEAWTFRDIPNVDDMLEDITTGKLLNTYDDYSVYFDSQYGWNNPLPEAKEILEMGKNRIKPMLSMEEAVNKLKSFNKGRGPIIGEA